MNDLMLNYYEYYFYQEMHLSEFSHKMIYYACDIFFVDHILHVWVLSQINKQIVFWALWFRINSCWTRTDIMTEVEINFFLPKFMSAVFVDLFFYTWKLNLTCLSSKSNLRLTSNINVYVSNNVACIRWYFVKLYSFVILCF